VSEQDTDSIMHSAMIKVKKIVHSSVYWHIKATETQTTIRHISNF